MIGLARLQLVYLFIGYIIGWVCHAVVYAGIFALLDKYKRDLLRRKRVQLEYWISAFAAFSSLAIPMVFTWVTANTFELRLPLIIAGVGTFMGYRRLRERAIEPELFKGDITGYGAGLAVTGLIFWLLLQE